ncbi:hypothetical protein CP082626L3_0163, partial [Chlamydia psittaci 08-2626_L3]
MICFFVGNSFSLDSSTVGDLREI